MTSTYTTLSTSNVHSNGSHVDPKQALRLEDKTALTLEPEWELRTARLLDWRTGEVVFEQKDVEVPSSWSQTATNILAQKYFRGTLGTDERETSLRQVVDRIAETIRTRALQDGVVPSESAAKRFKTDIANLLCHQDAAFNSPVWFNIGVSGVPQQASACFILSVDDTMESILNWYTEEGIIFKGGSGSGVNLSNLRASSELLEGGGTASGPVSFMRGADASAGTIKSGGKTRRAAKMVLLDVDHPDIEEFVWCKAREERKSRVLAEAGFDMSLNGRDAASVQYQNANNSVRVTDDFMQAVEQDDEWDLVARVDGRVIKTVPARSLLRQIAESAWECADPGVQFQDTITRWHTASVTGPITASNPCSEYVHLDNSACNLASLNLLNFLAPNGTFEEARFRSAVRTLFTAQDVLVSHADYPTPEITKNTRRFRQLGLGYANLGAMLMVLGLPYDSDAGRAVAAAVTALMTGQAYLVSTELAEKVGAFEGYEENREPMLRVLNQHREALGDIDAELLPEGMRSVLSKAAKVWEQVCARAEVFGVRNSQATVLAPTGTIGLLMDCDTTGIEPDLGLVKSKNLVGGGTMSIANQAVPRALASLGYDAATSNEIVDYVSERNTVIGSKLRDEHLSVFACSLGDNQISVSGHVDMMAAVQPFLSGAISKTVNLPAEMTVEDVEQVFIDGWRKGLKAVAVYRDGSKVAQPLTVKPKNETESAAQPHQPVAAPEAAGPVRKKLPKMRQSKTFTFKVADCKGFATVGEYDNGRPGEIFVHVSKQGSTLAGIMNAFAISVSHGLQYGVPLAAFVRMFVGTRFEPAGMTDDPDVRITSSLMDYLFRKLAVMYLPKHEREALGILTTDERRAGLPDVSDVADEELVQEPSTHLCMSCGVTMVRAGACFVCVECGTSSGCS